MGMVSRPSIAVQAIRLMIERERYPDADDDDDDDDGDDDDDDDADDDDDDDGDDDDGGPSAGYSL